MGDNSEQLEMNTTNLNELGVVVIGRNEGQLALDCIASIEAALGVGIRDRLVYADSGSSDGSPEQLEKRGICVHRLAASQPFTAARGRNEGFAVLLERCPQVRHVQFIDGDCELAAGWCEAGLDFLSRRPDVSVVSGRLRERFADKTVYHQLCEIEWQGASGEVTACGGIAMFRREAFAAAGGFRSDLVGGEEPELCVRLRSLGWKIWRLDGEMAVHDCDMATFSQWWRRMVRNGASFAEVYALHWRSRFSVFRRETLRAIAWGGVLPAMIAIGSTLDRRALLLLAVYPIQIVRTAMKRGAGSRLSWLYGVFMMVGKTAECEGIIRLVQRRLLRSNPTA